MKKIEFMYDRYKERFMALGKSEKQAHMLACIAVKDEFGDNMDIEELKALQAISKMPVN